MLLLLDAANVPQGHVKLENKAVYTTIETRCDCLLGRKWQAKEEETAKCGTVWDEEMMQSICLGSQLLSSCCRQAVDKL